MGTLFMKVESTTASTVKMNKLCLIFLGVLAIAAIVSAWDNEEDSSLSEELASSRLVRSADARRRKGKKGRKGRKARKGKKGRKSQSESRCSGREFSACHETAMTIMKIWKDVVTNFEKQHKRMDKQNGTGESKSGKKGEFKSAAQKLLSVGGGNKSALTCAGLTDNAGAAQMKNLTDHLMGCEDRIHTACNSTNFDVVNVTKLEHCKMVIEEFKTGAEECLGQSIGADKAPTDEACNCWTNETLAHSVELAKECKFNEEAKAFAAALKTCKSTFSECRKYEDEVAESIAACKSNADDLKKEVAALSQNHDAVVSAQQKVQLLAAGVTGRRMKREDGAAS